MSAQVCKPVIIIYGTGKVSEALLEQIQFGIEEEGIPYFYEEHPERTGKNLVSLAYAAAQSSALSVGIALDEMAIVVHYRNLREEQFVYQLKNLKEQEASVLRILGGNAAKLVKGIPLIGHLAFEVSF